MLKRLFSIFNTLLVTSLVLAACAPAATPTPQVITQVVKETQVVTVKETQLVQPTAAPQADRVQIYWYIGIGAGAQPAQIPLEKEFVEKFNASQTEIQLIPIIVDNKFARDNLTTQIAAGNAPDIVGPMGTAGRAAFPGAFLDLEPLVKEFNYDTSDIDPAFLQFYKDQGKLVGLPFAIFPSALFYNKDLFDEAGLAYPPQKVGEKYTLDGQELEWSFDTLRLLAQRLTVDENGNDASQASFDPTNIVQYGFDFQWTRDSPRWFSAYFEPHYPVKDGKADISPAMIDSMKWYYDAQFGGQPFLPTQAAIDSDLLKGNSFNSGKVAMGLTHLWYTCCIDPAVVKNWDVAVVPSYNGKTTSKMHGDTFAIMSSTKHPKEAFQVFTYLLNEGAPDLYKIYGGLPARTSQQSDFFKSLDEKFAPNKVNWQVFLDMIPYLDVPGHEVGLPNYAKAEDAWLKLGSALRSDDALDVDKAIADFKVELDTILQEK